jgi:terminase small subunit-like protein
MSETPFPLVPAAETQAIFAELSQLEQTFVQLVFSGLSPSDAVREARIGHQDDARQTARQLMRRRHVKLALVRLCTCYSDRNAVTPSQLVMLLRAHAFHDPHDIYEEGEGGAWTLRPLDEWPLEARLAVQQVVVRDQPTKGGIVRTTTVKFADRQHAAELLGRHLQMFDTKATGGSFELVIQAQAPSDTAPKPVTKIEGMGLRIELPPTS